LRPGFAAEYHGLMRNLIILLFGLLTFHSFAQEIERKSVRALRIEEHIKIDGKLDEAVWQEADVATDFRQFEPENGPLIPEKFMTEVRILYDDEAIYFGAYMRDPNPDSILTELGRRDDMNRNTDWFAIWINPYNDGQNDINFWVTAAGVQIDSRTTIYGDDMAWDAVWKSHVQITDDGWIAEVKLPYSALRLPDNETHLMGLNMGRQIRRYRELYTWNFLDRSFGTLEQQNGRLTDIENIQAPVRLSFMPYLSGYLLNDDGEFSTTYNAGMDLKYGVNESFTLDVTLIPDFGQARFDNRVLNLSPFEVRFNEYRQFFTEGTELFTKGDLFYTRRVGGTPVGFGLPFADMGENDSLISNPSTTRVLNAAKFSGRNKNGLGIGVFNGITANTEAEIMDTETGEVRSVQTQPMTNYNVLVLDQVFGDANYVTFVNTNTMRDKDWRRANVSGLLFRLQDKNNSHRLTGEFKSSMISQHGFTDVGYSTFLNIERIKGHWRWELGHAMDTYNYNPNDLGFLYNNNEINHWAGGSYQIFNPVGPFNRFEQSLYLRHSMLQRPNEYMRTGFSSNTFMVFRDFTYAGINLSSSPFQSYDYFEAREPGKVFNIPPWHYLGGWVSTDYRKPFAFDARLYFSLFSEMNPGEEYFQNYDQTGIEANISPRWRVNDNLSFVYSLNYTHLPKDLGWVNKVEPDTIVFGQRNLNTFVNTIRANYVFNPTTFINLDFRHYWSKADYDAYMRLDESGYLTYLPDYGIDHDINYNIWNLDLNLTWWFAPGSQMIILWRQQIGTVDDNVDYDFIRNLDELFDQPQRNTFSIRFLYYLDYNQLRGKHAQSREHN
jgi:hypothetical protein